jgi:hypothetical protein
VARALEELLGDGEGGETDDEGEMFFELQTHPGHAASQVTRTPRPRDY